MPHVKRARQAAAEATQRSIVEAAARLCGERGYHATSVAEIARAAGVAVQTIYNSVGGKRDVLSLVLDVAAAGPEAPAKVRQFMLERTEHETDPVKVIEALVDFWRGAVVRTAPVFRILREAAAVDPEAAELERARAAQRLRNYHEAARLLEQLGALRSGLGRSEAAAIIFALGPGESHATLRRELGWSVDVWCDWVRDALVAALLDPATRRDSR